MVDVPLVEVWNGPLCDPTGRPLHRVAIPVAAVIPENPFLRNGKGSVVTRTVLETDEAGIWRGQLIPISCYERTDAYYVADERQAGGGLVMFMVPDAGPVAVRSFLITQPPSGGDPADSEDYAMWFSGAGPPPDLIVGAKLGDVYVDDITGDIYQLR